MERIPLIFFKDRLYMYSDVLDVNFGQQCHIVQRVKEDCVFGNALQSLIEL